MTDLRGPCDCPACMAGDQDRCFWVFALENGLLGPDSGCPGLVP